MCRAAASPAYTYDNRNRMTKIEHKDGATVLDGYTYALDAAGGITRITDQNSEYWDYGYDGRNRLTSAVRKNSGATIAASYAYTYDAGDNLVTKVEPFKDDFNDGNYTGWTVLPSGTWGASNHYLTASSSSAVRAYRSNTGANCDLWFSYYDGDTSSTSYYTQVRFRFDLVSYLAVEIHSDKMTLHEYVNGGCDGETTDTTLDTNTNATTSQGVWYDVRVRYDGANVQVWRAQRGSGSEMTQVLSTSSATYTTTTYFAFYINSGTWRFDDVRLVSDSVSSTSTYTYDNGNELLTMALGGTNAVFTYDEWVRTVSKTMPSHTAAYVWRYGDKLKRYTTSFPDETSVWYNYDGLGKRRNRTEDPNNGPATWWRWDAEWNVIDEYNDSDSDWVIEGLSKTYVGSLAEIAGSNPSTGTYRYSSGDHLGSVRRIRDASKASLATYEYDPYGGQYAFSGLALNHGFTGHTWEPDLGLYYAPYRYYIPATARWLSRDPLGMVDGPNVYEYVGDTPTSIIDSLGLALHCFRPRVHHKTTDKSEEVGRECKRAGSILDNGVRLERDTAGITFKYWRETRTWTATFCVWFEDIFYTDCEGNRYRIGESPIPTDFWTEISNDHTVTTDVRYLWVSDPLPSPGGGGDFHCPWEPWHGGLPPGAES